MKRFFAVLCLILAFSTLTSALYSSNSKVVKLTTANFKEKVLQGNEVWFVEFYAPWCGHCKSLAPEWEKLANALDGIIKVGAVDMTTDQDAGSAYGIRGFPTLKFFGADKKNPVDYQGQRAAPDMMKFAFDNARKAAEAKLSGRSSGGSSSSSGGSSGGSGGSDKDVVVLTASNFDQVMNSEEMWIVEFYAPWCGHCKRLEPEWSQAATQLKGEVKLAKVDATVEQSLASKYGVNGYPTIKVFPAGPKKENLVEDYQGGREAASIVSWALEKNAQSKPAMKVLQLTDSEVFDKYCTNLRGVCFIAFLPHIYDSSAAERNRYIELFQDLSRSNKANPVSFLWSQGGDYYSIEESLGLGSGYPALVAISINKMKYAPFTGIFDKKNIEGFVKSLLAGKQPLFDLREAPKIKKVDAWDGKDKKPAEYDL